MTASLRPVLDLLRDFFAPHLARVLRWHASQLHPLAPTRMHRRIAFALAALERRA